MNMLDVAMVLAGRSPYPQAAAAVMIEMNTSGISARRSRSSSTYDYVGKDK